MKKLFVIPHTSEVNGHLNSQNILPSSCALITGVTATATSKQVGQLYEKEKELSFPQALITELLYDERISNLFYSYLRTRLSEEESKTYFKNAILPTIVRVLSNNIYYSCLSPDKQEEFNVLIGELLTTHLTDYLYNQIQLYPQGQNLTDTLFFNLIAQQTLQFLHAHKADVFTRTIQSYKTPEPYECGNISLLVNGNSFLLREHFLIANREFSHLKNEIIPFYEPLEVNSYIQTIFINNKKSGENPITIRVYIEYETLSKKEGQLLKQEDNSIQNRN